MKKTILTACAALFFSANAISQTKATVESIAFCYSIVEFLASQNRSYDVLQSAIANLRKFPKDQNRVDYYNLTTYGKFKVYTKNSYYYNWDVLDPQLKSYLGGTCSTMIP
jgi:hypothetical protein